MSLLLRLSCSPSGVGSIKLLSLQILRILSSSLTLSMLLKESLILCLIYIKHTLQLSLKSSRNSSKLVSTITSISRTIPAKLTGLYIQQLIVIPKSLLLLYPSLVNYLGISAKVIETNPFSTLRKWLSKHPTSREDNSLNYLTMTSILLNCLPRMGAYGSSS